MKAKAGQIESVWLSDLAFAFSGIWGFYICQFGQIIHLSQRQLSIWKDHLLPVKLYRYGGKKVGCVYMWLCTPGMAPDEDNHFRRAFEICPSLQPAVIFITAAAWQQSRQLYELSGRRRDLVFKV